MDNPEIIAVFIVLIIGSYLFYVARSYGKKQKIHYEARAVKALDKALVHLRDDPKSYKVIARNQSPLLKAKWEPSNLQLLHNQIIDNCTKNVPGNGDVYTDSEFCLCIDEPSQTIYYIIGRSEYDFSQLEKKE